MIDHIAPQWQSAHEWNPCDVPYPFIHACTADAALFLCVGALGTRFRFGRRDRCPLSPRWSDAAARCASRDCSFSAKGFATPFTITQHLVLLSFVLLSSLLLF